MSVFCTFAAKSWKRKAFNLGCRGSAAFLLKSNTLQSLWGGVQTVFKNFSWSYQRNNKWSTWSWGFLPGCSRPSGNTCNRKTKQENTAFLQMWSYEMMTLVENIWTKYYVILCTLSVSVEFKQKPLNAEFSETCWRGKQMKMHLLPWVCVWGHVHAENLQRSWRIIAQQHFNDPNKVGLVGS